MNKEIVEAFSEFVSYISDGMSDTIGTFVGENGTATTEHNIYVTYTQNVFLTKYTHFGISYI
jgi:hypothetical protein